MPESNENIAERNRQSQLAEDLASPDRTPGHDARIEFLRKSEKELLKLQFSSFLDVYKDHFDLFLRGVVGYFVVVGTLAGLTFAKGAPVRQGIVFSTVTSIASVIALFACMISKKWVKDLETALGRITTALAGEPFPFSGAKGILDVMMAISIVLCVGGFVELWIVRNTGG